MRRIPAVLLLALPIALCGSARAQTTDSLHVYRHQSTPRMRAARRSGPISVDGRLDDAAWDAATPATIFTQSDPKEGEPASERTEVRILVDEDAIYVGARLFDGEPGLIRKRLARRDDATDSDYLEVAFDCYHDHLTAYKFRLNPAGSIRDASVFSSGNEDNSWDPVWEYAASVDSLGWTAEMRIPLSQLHYNQVDDAVWGVQLVRFIYRKQETDYFSFTPKKEQGGVSRYGHLAGLGALPTHANLEVLPYTVGRAEYRSEAPGNPFRTGNDYFGSAGLDIKYALTSDLTLSGTVNPDFGQAEVDAAVVNLSQFETQFPEKRPFFVADQGNFTFANYRSMNNFGFGQLFYTRRIGRPPHRSIAGDGYDFVDAPDQTRIDGAAKLTGRTQGGWTVGLLEALTSREQARFLDAQGSLGNATVEPLTNFFVGSLHKAIRNGDTQFGALLTAVNRKLNDPMLERQLRSSAYLGGFDWNHAWHDRDWSFDGYLTGSYVRGSADAIARTQLSPDRYFQRPDARSVHFDPTRTSLAGYQGTVALSKNNGEHWLGSVTSQWMSPGFEVNDLGFETRADQRTIATILLYKQDNPGPIFRSYSAYPFEYHRWNSDGDLTGAGFAAEGNGTLRNYWYVDLKGTLTPSVVDDQRTRGGPVITTAKGYDVQFSVVSDGRKPYTLTGFADVSANDKGGQGGSYSLTMSFRPHPGLQVQVGPEYDWGRAVAQYVTTVSDPQQTATYGSRYVFAVLAQKTASMVARVNWTFSPRMSLQLYAQPLISSGKYNEFKELHAPRTFQFDVYGNQIGTIAKDSTGGYVVDPDGVGPSDPFSFANPDFNFRSIRGNAVLRWEYRPGSTLFLIWQHMRSDVGPEGDLSLGRDLGDLFRAKADNIFMAKVTTWFGL